MAFTQWQFCGCFIPDPYYIIQRIFRTTEWLRLKGTSGDHVVQLSVQTGSPVIYCPGLCPEGFWISSGKQTSQPVGTTCSVTLMVKNYFLMFNWNNFCCSLCLLLLILLMDTTKKGLAPSLWHPPFRNLYTCILIFHVEKYHLFSWPASKLTVMRMKESKGSWRRFTEPDTLVVVSILDSRYFASTSSHTVCQPHRNRGIICALCLLEVSGSTVLNYGFAPIALSSWHCGQAWKL